MKLDIAVPTLTSSNVEVTGEFRIRNSAKAFNILSSGLYSNKIRAIIRELSTNAVDSHVAANNTGTPFVVHLPSVIEPYFSVRDYGTGLSESEITSIYTTYFESTKVESNDFVGALGLGSKSPFSYTENFLIISIKNGIKVTYTAFINDAGIPSVALMDKCDAEDEPNGVEVRFAVVKTTDYSVFINEAREVFAWFDKALLPKVIGVNFTLKEIEFYDTVLLPEVHQMKFGNNTYAVMGNIAYPLIDLPNQLRDNYSNFLDLGLVFKFDIGELDFAASRESLSYIPSTITSLQNKFDKLIAKLQDDIEKAVDAETDEWKKAEVLVNFFTERIYKSAVKGYVAKHPECLVNIGAYNGVLNLKLKDSELATHNVTLKAFLVDKHKVVIHKPRWNYSTKSVDEYSIPVANNTLIVLNDLNVGCFETAKNHYRSTKYIGYNVYCFSSKEKDLVKRQEAYNTILQMLHYPNNVVKASSLVVEKSSQKSLNLTTPSGICRLTSNRNEYTWERIDNAQSIFDNTDIKYYVPINGYSVCTKDWLPVSYNIGKVMYNVRLIVNHFLQGQSVYGVRKSLIKRVQNDKTWVNLEDKIKEILQKYPIQNITNYILERDISSVYVRKYESIRKIAGHLAQNSYLREELKVCEALHAPCVSSNVFWLCNTFLPTEVIEQCEKDASQIKQSIIDCIGKIEKVFPLLPYAEYAPVTLLVDYVNLISKSFIERS